MKNNILRLFIIVGCGITLIACQNSQSPAGDPRLNEGSFATFFSDSGIKSCISGATVGGVGCLLTTNKTKECAVVAAVGCAIFMGGDYYLEQKRKEYSSKEQRLNAYLADVRADSAKVQKLTNMANVIAKDNLQKLAALQKRIKAKTVEKNKALAELESIDATQKELTSRLNNMKKSLDSYTTVAKKERQAGMKTDKLDQEIKQYKQRIKALEKIVFTVADQRAIIKSVG